MKIAIVGAGIAGLACARALVAQGHEVVVFERADGVGGRVATLRTEIGGFDHGAQYLTARSVAFENEVQRWSRAGVVLPWSVRARSLDGKTGTVRDEGSSRDGTVRWVGVPGMAALGTALATGLDVRTGARVVRLEAAEGNPGRWLLQLESDVGFGPFDAVVVATPPVIAASLLAAAPALAAEAASAHVEPCWALLLAFPEAIAAHHAAAVGDAAFVNSGRLAWLARESSKPQRRLGERWTAHAQSAWSVEHFDDDPEDVKTKLLRAFHEVTGTDEQPLWAQVHRWRHALPRTSLTCRFLWDPERRIGACGDWCHGFRIEDAWLSGDALAQGMAAAR